MRIQDVASQFSVFLLHPTMGDGNHLKLELQGTGYDVEIFEDEEACLAKIEKKSPHIFLLYTEALKTSLSDVIERVMKANGEIRWIAVTTSPQFDILAQYKEYGCADIIVEDAASLEERIRWSIDRVCESIYQQYQNEQLFTDLKRLQKEMADASAAGDLGPYHPLKETLKSYALTSTPEQTLGVYLQEAPAAGIFFRYVDATKSFIVQNVSTLAEAAKGLGFQADIRNLPEFFEQIRKGEIPQVLRTLCERNLEWKNVMAFAVEGSIEGLLVHPGADEALNARLFDYFKVFELYLENRTLRERVQRHAYVDPQTELFNYSYYVAKLKEEIERSRRLQKPLSLMKVSIDDFIEIEQSLGENTRDHLVKSLAQKIRASGRTNDINCRTKTNEFSLILPHSSKKGALVRAERLRRTIESQSVAEYGVKVSISCGISEFPTLSSSAENLDLTAGQSLNHIMEKGGNKIAVFKPSEGHKPEFPVLDEEG